MKILLIHQAFASIEDAGGTRHFEFARHLKAFGDRFTIIASQVSGFTGKRFAPHRRGLMYEDAIGDLRIIRAYTPAVMHQSFVWRVFAFVVFSFTSIWAGIVSGHVDIVMGTTPPIFQGFSAWLVAMLRGKPFLLEVRDLWPDFAIDMGVLRNPILISLARWGELFLYSQADRILVNSPAYEHHLRAKGVLPTKIKFVSNGVDVHMFDPENLGAKIRKQYDLEEKVVVVYAGAHGPANGLDVVLRAAEHLKSRANIHFLMVGDGKDRALLETEAIHRGLTNMTFAGALPKSEMPDVLAASDICIATLMNIPMFATTYPNKVFDYMAAGRPTVLAIAGVIQEVIEKANGGICVAPGDDQALATAIITMEHDPELRRQMGRSARVYVEERFDRGRQALEFRQLLLEMPNTRDDSKSNL